MFILPSILGAVVGFGPNAQQASVYLHANYTYDLKVGILDTKSTAWVSYLKVIDN